MWAKTKNITLTNGVISAISFAGAGTNDLSVIGRPAFAATRSYRVTVDSANETFKWSKDGGATFEATGIPIGLAKTPFPLRNSLGELEGLSLLFGSSSGHVNTNHWDFTTTGDVVLNAEATLGNGLVVNAGSADGVIFHGQYAKGAEDGLRIRIAPLMSGSSASYFNDLSLPLNLGNGVLRHQAEYFEMLATVNYTYRVNLLGIGAFDVRQVRSGAVGGTGLFTCFAELYKIVR